MRVEARDIFLSYARGDRAEAERLAEALGERGWSVWWDRMLSAGQEFTAEIEQRISSAQVVVVLWSRESVASGWVRDEAGVARDQGKLIPVRLDDAVVPLGFRQIHTRSLRDAGDVEDLIADLMQRLDGAEAQLPDQPTVGRTKGRIWWGRRLSRTGGRLIGMSGLVGLCLLVVGRSMLSGQESRGRAVSCESALGRVLAADASEEARLGAMGVVLAASASSRFSTLALAPDYVPSGVSISNASFPEKRFFYLSRVEGSDVFEGGFREVFTDRGNVSFAESRMRLSTSEVQLRSITYPGEDWFERSEDWYTLEELKCYVGPNRQVVVTGSYEVSKGQPIFWTLSVRNMADVAGGVER